MGKKVKLGGLALIASLLLAGCGQVKMPDVIENTSVMVSERGEITSYLVGSFDRDYYSVAELRDFVMTEASRYNTEKKASEGEKVPVEVLGVENEEDGRVVVTRAYSSAAAYEDMEDCMFWFGKVSEAGQYLKNVGDGVILQGTKDGKFLDSSELVNGSMGDKHIIITDTKARIYCPYRVEYYVGCVRNDDGSLDSSGLAEGAQAVIVMK